LIYNEKSDRKEGKIIMDAGIQVEQGQQVVQGMDSLPQRVQRVSDQSIFLSTSGIKIEMEWLGGIKIKIKTSFWTFFLYKKEGDWVVRRVDPRMSAHQCLTWDGRWRPLFIVWPLPQDAFRPAESPKGSIINLVL
jgi:hypothetical protein